VGCTVDLVGEDDVGEDRPRTNSKLSSFWLKTLEPVMSEGRRSGVDWMRRNVPADRGGQGTGEGIVLPVPGRSWRRTWPPATRPARGEPHDTVFADDDPMDVGPRPARGAQPHAAAGGSVPEPCAIQSSEELPLFPSRN